MINAELGGQASMEELGCLVYELLDAHQDTMQLITASEMDERWAAHLDYLRDLQRVGRERLARVGALSG